MARYTNRILVIAAVILAMIALVGIAAGTVTADAGSPTVSMSEDTVEEDDADEEDEGDDSEETTNDSEDAENGDDEAAPQDAFFEIHNVETNSPIVEGETATVTVDMENTGETEATKDVWFKLDRWRKAETEVSLAAGENRTVELEWVSELGDDKEWDLTAATPDDSVVQQYTIRDSSDDATDDDSSSSSSTWTRTLFEIDDVETNAPINADETLTLTINVTNTGDRMTQKRVWFEFDDSVTNETQVILYPDETETVELSYDTDAEEFGSWNVTVHTPDDSETVPVDIAELRPEYLIESVEMNTPIEAGETVNVTANVTNAGNIAGNESIWFEIENQSIDRTTHELEINESSTVTLVYNSDRGAVGEWNASVRTETDRHNETVTLTEPETSESTESSETTTQSETDSAPASTSSSEEPDPETDAEDEEPSPDSMFSEFDLGPLGIGAAFVVALTSGAVAFRMFG